MSKKARQVKVTLAAAEAAGQDDDPASGSEVISPNGTDSLLAEEAPQPVEIDESQANGDAQVAQAAPSEDSGQPADAPAEESLSEERDRLRKE